MKKGVALLLLSIIFGLASTWSFDRPEFDSGMGYDSLRNTSRLTNAELRDGFEHFREWQMQGKLDRDRDGIADFTGIAVEEFLQRMKIILSDLRPFNYSYGTEFSSLEGDELLRLVRHDSIDI